MTQFARPRLIDADARLLDRDGHTYLFVTNRNRFSDQGLCVPTRLAAVLELLDGRRSIDEVHREAALRMGVRMELAVLEELIHALDGIYVLEGERYRARKREVEREFLDAPVREPVCAGGVYSADPDDLRGQLDRLYTTPGGPGPANPGGAREGSVRMVLSPHIDYRRGGSSFAWAYKSLVERTRARVFVILGTSHYSLHRYVLTRKDFRTPLGVARTDAGFLDRLEARLGRRHFEDEIAHKPEHSIELQVVLLQHALAGRRDAAIVPILVGSFGDYLDEGREPTECDATREMIGALSETLDAWGEEACVVVSGDLAHIGPKFGDPLRVDAARGDWCRRGDLELVGRIETADPQELWTAMLADGDERRICGFPPLYVGLASVRPARGRLLAYDQFVDPRGLEIVSFAAMEFE